MEQASTVTFAGMVETSLNNFLFLYDDQHESQLNVTQTSVTYDTDPTSNETLIAAVKYAYNNVHGYEEIVDASYHNILLSQTVRDGSTILISNRAYEYTKSVSDWSSAYFGYRHYQAAPTA